MEDDGSVTDSNDVKADVDVIRGGGGLDGEVHGGDLVACRETDSIPMLCALIMNMVVGAVGVGRCMVLSVEVSEWEDWSLCLVG